MTGLTSHTSLVSNLFCSCSCLIIKLTFPIDCLIKLNKFDYGANNQ